MSKKPQTTSNTPRLTLEEHCALTLESLNQALVERGASYGSFFQNSEIAVSLREMLEGNANAREDMSQRLLAGLQHYPESLIYVLLNATNMITAKQSRLFATPTHKDSWLDLAGYAILAHAAISMVEKGDA